MDRDQIHFELFVRRKPTSSWALELASEDRGRVVGTAEEMIKSGTAVAVRVTKETLGADTGEFRSVTILTLGDQQAEKAKKEKREVEPLCSSPSDLYTLHSRERIGRLLDNWLLRNKVTPFELLHRPDLVEKLEASGVELQHAFQKIAVPEAQERGGSVHEVMRVYQALVERAVERLLKDHRRGALPNLAKESFASAVERLMGDPERSYLIGCGVAAAIAPAKTWADKVDKLMDLADAAPQGADAKALALHVLEMPLAELLGAKASLTELLGPELELGETLAALTRLACSDAVDILIRVEPSVGKIMPTLEGATARLSKWLTGPYFAHARAAIARRVLHELTGPRRLKPTDPEAEIATLRGLAMALTASAGKLLSLDDVQSAFSTRSRALVASDFVETLVGQGRSAKEEAEALLRLTENVVGGAAKRQAARWLAHNISALRFEKELRYGPDSPTARLAALASLQRHVNRCGLAPEDQSQISAKLGDIGGQIEADCNLLAMLAKAPAPASDRLNLLLRLALGEMAPLGPCAERSKLEVMKLIRLPGIRAELSQSPETLERLRGFLAAA